MKRYAPSVSQTGCSEISLRNLPPSLRSFLTPLGSLQRGSRDSNFAVSSGDRSHNAYFSDGFARVSFQSCAAAFQTKRAASIVG